MTNLERRDFLKVSGAGFASMALPLPRGHRRWAFSEDEPSPTLVTIYLRGGMDALNAVVPYSDKRYYELRPTLAIQPEDTAEAKGVIRLDSDFGLHPSLAPLEPFWKSEQLAVVVNAGSPHSTRSHFDAQDFMEYAAPGMRTVRDGWLNRYLHQSRPSERDRGKAPEPALRALAMQGLLPRSLRGEFTVLAVPEKNVLEDERILDLFGPLYGGDMSEGERDEELVFKAGRDTLETLKHFREVVAASKESGRGGYPSGSLASKMRDLARVIRAGEGLEVAALDLNGWDTHINQGATTGAMPNLLSNLSGTLAAFMNDLGPYQKSTVVMVMTEFGRTCRENGNYCTDHGHGGLMFLLGGGVEGG